MILPPKPFFPPLTCSRVVTESLRSQVKTPLLKHLQVLGPFTLPFSRFFPLGNRLTENQCQSVTLGVTGILTDLSLSLELFQQRTCGYHANACQRSYA